MNNMQKKKKYDRYYMSRGLPKAYKCWTNKTGRPYVRCKNSKKLRQQHDSLS